MSAAVLLSLPSNAREWRNADGNKSFQGQLVCYYPPEVTVVRDDDGREITFQDKLLSEADKRYCQIASRVVSQSLPQIPYRIKSVAKRGVFCTEQPDDNPYFRGGTFLIWGTFDETVKKGASFRHDLYWAGPYRTVKTGAYVSSYTLTLDHAVEIWEQRLNAPEKGEPKKDDGKEQDPAPDREIMAWTGSGFAVSASGHIVTNAHVVNGATNLMICMGEKKHRAKILAIDAPHDLAIVKIDQPTAPLFINRGGLPALADDVLAAGFPDPETQGRSIKITKGVINGLKGAADAAYEYQIDAAVQPGNSGGPLLDRNLRVIGVIHSRLNASPQGIARGSVPQNVNYAVKLDYLVALTKKVDGLSKEIDGLQEPASKPTIDAVTKSTFLIEGEKR